MIDINSIILGDCLEAMKDIPDGSVDLIITSPPYFLNKQYEKTWNYDYYCHLMDGVFSPSSKVLKQGGYMVVNFGDYFNSGNRFYDAQVPSVYPASINYFNWGIKNGFDLQATRIWRKQFAKCAIPMICNTHPRNVFDYEHIWTFRKKGEKEEFVNDRKLSQRGVIGEDWKAKAGLNVHCAAFPVELPTYAIKVYSKPNDTVLDMFMGSGTTCVAAIREKRHYIGIELNEEYFNIAKKRIENELKQPTLF